MANVKVHEMLGIEEGTKGRGTIIFWPTDTSNGKEINKKLCNLYDKRLIEEYNEEMKNASGKIPFCRQFNSLKEAEDFCTRYGIVHDTENDYVPCYISTTEGMYGESVPVITSIWVEYCIEGGFEEEKFLLHKCSSRVQGLQFINDYGFTIANPEFERFGYSALLSKNNPFANPDIWPSPDIKELLEIHHADVLSGKIDCFLNKSELTKDEISRYINRNKDRFYL